MQGTLRGSLAMTLALAASPRAHADPTPAAAASGDDAQQPTPAPEREPELVEVEIVGDRADAIQKIPGSFTVLRKDELQRGTPVNTAELLRRVPGLYVREDTSGGGRLDIGIRGLDPGRSRRLLVLEDGVPLAINPYAEPDLYFSPQIERFEKIEVLKGSGSILYGPQTLGGVVNFATHTPPDGFASYAQLDVGQYGFVRGVGRVGVGIPVGFADEPVRLLAQVVAKRTDGARDQPAHDLDVLTKAVLPLSDEARLTLKVAGHRATAQSEDVGLPRDLFRGNPRAPGLSPASRSELYRFDGAATLDADLGEGTSARVVAYTTHTQRSWRRQLYDRVPESDASYLRVVGDTALPLGAIYFRDEARVLERSYWVFGLEPRVTTRFATGDVRHTVDFGLRVLGETTGQTDDEESDAFGGQVTLGDAESRLSLGLALFAQDRILFRDWLVVTPGVRLEHASYQRGIERLDGAAVDVAGSDSSFAVIPGIGMTVGVPRAHAFAGMHLGYGPPRASEAISTEGTAQLLSPERSTNWEVGGRAKPIDALMTDATLFWNEFSNQIVPNTTPGAPTELVNGGRTRSFGGEGSALLRVGEIAELPIDIDVTGRVGLMSAQFAEGAREGKRLPYAPASTATAMLDLGLPLGFGGSMTMTYVGAMFADDANTQEVDASGRVGAIPASVVLDATLRFQEPRSGLGITLAGKNLLDRPFVIARRPEGIWASGFRQLIASVSFTTPDSP
jgi:Fe(3+) dicitrate transport protein